MLRRLFVSLIFLVVTLLIIGYVLSRGIAEKAQLEYALVAQANIQDYVHDMMFNITNAQLFVYMKEAGHEVDNDWIIDAINKFDEDIRLLEHKLNVEIDTRNCLSCHVSVQTKVLQMDRRLTTIKHLVADYQMRVSTLFTTLDRGLRERREKEIGELGNEIVSETRFIYHITSTMIAELDRATRRSYLEGRKNAMWAIGIGMFCIFIVIGYLAYALTNGVQSLIRDIELIAQSDFNEKIHLQPNRELVPLVHIFNNMIDEINVRGRKITHEEEDIRKSQFKLDELKLTMEDRVRTRTEEINKTNRELIENQLKLEKTYNELQEKSKELAENNLRLQELDKLKSDFISMTNHEIRTPVVTVKGYTEVLLSGALGELPSKALNSLKIMSRSINRLTSIIESTRAYTLADSKGKIHLSKMMVADFLTDIYNDMQALTEKRNQRLIVNSPQECPPVTCDAVQIYQAMVNLVINSIRYTPDGRDISIGASYSKKAKEVTFWVKDEGMGIEQKELKNIFLPYYEVKSAREHHSGTIEFNSGGTGLGLAIVKKLIEKHNGRVWAESPGFWKGSTFYFTLPLSS